MGDGKKNMNCNAKRKRPDMGCFNCRLSLAVLSSVAVGCETLLASPIDVQLVREELSKGQKIADWGGSRSLNDPETRPFAVKNTEDGNLRLTDVKRPELALFAPAGKDRSPAMIVCPGGAYIHLSYKTEGTEIAEWLQGLGIAAFVLKYSCPDCPDKALADVQRAIALVRSRADEWNIDPERVGVMGFSAGGNLAARVSTNWRHRAYSPVDEADAFPCRPDFTVLIYPAYLVPGARGGSTLPVTLCGEYPVDAQTPPAFILQTQDDPAHVENAIAYGIALKYAGVDAELHVFAKGGHGFGLRKRGAEVDGWEALAAKWLGHAAFSANPNVSKSGEAAK